MFGVYLLCEVLMHFAGTFLNSQGLRCVTTWSSAAHNAPCFPSTARPSGNGYLQHIVTAHAVQTANVQHAVKVAPCGTQALQNAANPTSVASVRPGQLIAG